MPNTPAKQQLKQSLTSEKLKIELMTEAVFACEAKDDNLKCVMGDLPPGPWAGMRTLGLSVCGKREKKKNQACKKNTHPLKTRKMYTHKSTGLSQCWRDTVRCSKANVFQVYLVPHTSSVVCVCKCVQPRSRFIPYLFFFSQDHSFLHLLCFPGSCCCCCCLSWAVSLSTNSLFVAFFPPQALGDLGFHVLSLCCFCGGLVGGVNCSLTP